jgi:hypothetical protein
VDSVEEDNLTYPSKPPINRAVRAAREAGNLLTPDDEGMLKSDPLEDYAASLLKIPLAEMELGGRMDSRLIMPTRTPWAGMKTKESS